MTCARCSVTLCSCPDAVWRGATSNDLAARGARETGAGLLPPCGSAPGVDPMFHAHSATATEARHHVC